MEYFFLVTTKYVDLFGFLCLLEKLELNPFLKNLCCYSLRVRYFLFNYLVTSSLNFGGRDIYCDDSFTFLFGVRSHCINVSYINCLLNLSLIYFLGVLSYCLLDWFFYPLSKHVRRVVSCIYLPLIRIFYRNRSNQ